MRQHRRGQRILHGELRKNARHLERPPDPPADNLRLGLPGDIDAIQPDLPGIRFQLAGYQVEEGRLACSIWPDDGGQ